MNVQENIPLNDFTTFKLGGPARYFVKVKNIEELKQSIKWSKAHNVPFLIIGGGSNILFSDQGFDGLVIKNELKGINFVGESVTASSGEIWDDFVSEVVSRGLYGVENMSGIPGTVGATPVQNVGAYGTEVKDVIETVQVLDTETFDIKAFTNKECKFDYRDSLFKSQDGKKYIITSVTFKLTKNGDLNIKYRDFIKYFEDNKNIKPTLETARQAVLYIRSRKFPDLSVVGCGGSFFKNPIISDSELDSLLKDYPEVPHFDVAENKNKIPLAWILENVVHCKGLKEGNVGLSDKQPLILINFGGATTAEVKTFSKKISDFVFVKTKIKIFPEVLFF